jgi:hypothetical protein
MHREHQHPVGNHDRTPTSPPERVTPTRPDLQPQPPHPTTAKLREVAATNPAELAAYAESDASTTADDSFLDLEAADPDADALEADSGGQIDLDS